MNMNRKFVIVVLIILFSPLVFSLGHLTFNKLSNSKTKIRLNFKRDYFFKDELLSMNKVAKNKLFGTHLIPKRALDLNNGWAVVGDAFSDALSESKAMVIFSKSELKYLKKKIKSQNDWLKNKGIKFYIAIAPNKLTTYDTLIPITRRDRNSKLQQLDSLCKELGIRFINMGEKFKENDSLQLYHKTDTHWNHMGAFLGYEASMDVIKKDFSNNTFREDKLDRLNRDSTLEFLGDLNVMLKKETKEEWQHLEFNSSVCAEQIPDRLSVPKGYYGDPTKYGTRFKNQEMSLKFLVFGDSFMGYCKSFFVENFKETVFIWDHIFNTELINKEQPDIVFFEFVERNIDNILKNEVINKSEDKIAPK